MSLRLFLEDLYDLSIDKIDISQVIQFEVSELKYDALFREKSVIHSLLFSFVWKTCFGVAPSWMELNRAKEKDPSNVTDILQWIVNNSFLKYLPDVARAKEADLKQTYGQYFNSLHTPEKVRQELQEKLITRYSLDRSVAQTSVSLFKFYVNNVKVAKAVTAQYRNPFTGLQLQKHAPLTLDPMTPRDIAQYSILSDHYFLRTLYGRDGVFVHGTPPVELVQGVVDALAKPVILFTTRDYDIPGSKQFLVETEEMFKLVPSMLRTCFVIDLDITDRPLTEKSVNRDTIYVLDAKDPRAPSTTIRWYTDRQEFVNSRCYKPALCMQTDPVINNRLFYKHFVSTVLKSQRDPRYLFGLNFITKLYLKTSKAPVAPRSAKHAVVMIDNRENIMSVVSTVISMSHLSTDWQLVIVTRDKNKAFYNQYLAAYRPIYILDPIQEVEPFDIEDYNLLLKGIDFWYQLVAYDKVLTIQDDGLLFRSGIDKFLDYAYVGAPWDPKHPENVIMDQVCNPHLVGNGGFSLRCVETMLQILQQFEPEKRLLFNNDLSPIPEDVYFAKFTYKLGKKFPTSDVALSFASEQLLSPESIGLHKVWHYHMPETLFKWFDSILDD